MNKSVRTIFYILSILLAVSIAFGFRAHAARTLAIDFDEDDYLRAGQEYAQFIRDSNWRGFLNATTAPSIRRSRKS